MAHVLRPASHPLALFVVAIVLGMALVSAACGGDDDNSSTSTAKSQAAASQTIGSSASAGASEQPTAEPTTNNGGGSETEACKLLTPDDVTNKFGSDWTIATTSTDPAGPYAVCYYSLESQANGNSISGLPAHGFVQILTRELSRDEFDAIAQAAAGAVGTEAKQISDIGDSAFAIGPILYVYKNGREFNIFTSGPKLVGDTEELQLKGAEDLARVVLTRL